MVNLVDFMVNSGRFHGKDLYLACICIGMSQRSKNTAFSGRSNPFMYICIGSDEKYRI